MTRRSGQVLVVTDRRFWRRSIGSEQRVASLVEHLSDREGGVVVAFLGRISPAERLALRRFCAPHAGLEVRTRPGAIAASFGSHLAAMATALRDPGRRSATRLENPLLTARSTRRRRFVEELVRALDPRAVIVEFLRLTATVHPRPVSRPGIAYLVDTHDVLHQRAARYRAGGAAVANAIEARNEAEALATFDAILAIQAREARAIRELVPDKPVLVVPHGLTLPMPAPGFAPGPRPIRLGLLGGRDESNRSGLSWFLEHVWGKLEGRFGDRIELRVAGRICESWRQTEKGMRILGAVASIDDFWPEIDVAINPIRFGSGLKIKNVEALAYGRALVTSPVGAEGLEDAAPAGLRIADAPEEWLQILGAWIEQPDLLAEVGRLGRIHAERHFSPTTAFRELDAFLDALSSVGAARSDSP